MNRREAIQNAVIRAGASALGLLSSQRAFALLSACYNTAPLVPAVELPEPLVFPDGKVVHSFHDWERRRASILKTATEQMYGAVPASAGLRFAIREHNVPALNGRALRTQIRLLFKCTPDGPSGDLLLYTPRSARRAPAILGLNFWGNHTVCSDPGIYLSRNWVESGQNIFANLSCVVNHRSTEACRGIDAHRWPVEEILERGYAFATMYRGDIDPDVADGSVPGLRSHYPELESCGDNFSAIAAWAWTLSRCLDYLRTNHRIDPCRVAVFGWSRLGKAAVWAGANDPRFAAVISNESGAGGAKLFRRDVGEDIYRLNTVFPHWFCRNFRHYNRMDKKLPFDQHLVLSCIAPRPLYVASAIEDKLSDPEGEFTSVLLASAVYRFLGVSGLSVRSMPPVGKAVIGRVSYHVRSGGHDVKLYDWQMYLDFLDAYVRGTGPK